MTEIEKQLLQAAGLTEKDYKKSTPEEEIERLKKENENLLQAFLEMSQKVYS